MKFYNTPNTIPASTVMNQTINSQAMQLLQVITYSFQIFFTGTPTGNFKLQGSDDNFPNQVPDVTWPAHWTDVANSTLNVVAAGNVMWTVQFPGYNYVRAVYTDSSGGTSTAIITSSTFNAKG